MNQNEEKAVTGAPVTATAGNAQLATDATGEFALGDAPVPETPPELDSNTGLGSDVDPSVGGMLSGDH